MVDLFIWVVVMLGISLGWVRFGRGIMMDQLEFFQMFGMYQN